MRKPLVNIVPNNDFTITSVSGESLGGDNTTMLVGFDKAGHISCTNYWRSAFADKGLVFMVVVDNCLVLFIPDSLESELRLEVANSVNNVQVEYGQLSEGHGKGFHMTFEDHSDRPYQISVVDSLTSVLTPDLSPKMTTMLLAFSSGNHLQLPAFMLVND